jgi:hypothetical protein
LDRSLLVKEGSMPRDSARVLQLPLFVYDTVGYLDAVARYEAIRPVLKKVSKKLHVLTAGDYTRGYAYPTTIPDRSQ